ncbi:hypothetical protein [Paenibacillus sp. DYY-L-2]|uniref:hypothetical protein n=1 Tax=Paenibacillus sp. DYY-L-2 TaxID=3447013 RepID=UPI003F50335B
MNINRQLTFLIRRIENNIDREHSILGVINLLKNDGTTIEEICRVVENDIIYKVEVLNTIGIGCFSNEEYDFVIPFLEMALRYSPTDSDTIYNIGYVLSRFGLNDEALRFLDQVYTHDEGVLELKQQIREKIN